jgi:hypothetical protein
MFTNDLREEMISDRIVVGIKDANLSVKMQLDPDLTLKKATDMARQSSAPVSILKLSSLLLIQNFFVQALLNLLSIVPRNPSFCSPSMVTDLTELLVAQHFHYRNIVDTMISVKK